MGWCFALLNSKLAEIYFDKRKSGQIKIWGHCFVNKKEYKTKREQKWIQDDTKRVKVVYRKKRYRLIG